ncbi:MAG: hypothetical protein RL172_1213 [Bacteroidota bacterium]|jgi:hypothetical protein
MKKILSVIIGSTIASTSIAQQKNVSDRVGYIDVAYTMGSSRNIVAASYVHNWRVGAKGKWQLGIGGRLTSSIGTKQAYITAPARLARTSTIPFLVVFSGQNIQNWDTLTVQRPWINSVNLSFNVLYQFARHWAAGFNIDVIGFSVGRNSAAILTSNGATRTEPLAKPAAFNLLLTGDLDHGSLNSEFFIRYQFKGKWGVRVIYQFLFNEYKITSIFQTAPDGTMVNRFRSKTNNLGIGISYLL